MESLVCDWLDWCWLTGRANLAARFAFQHRSHSLWVIISLYLPEFASSGFTAGMTSLVAAGWPDVIIYPTEAQWISLRPTWQHPPTSWLRVVIMAAVGGRVLCRLPYCCSPAAEQMDQGSNPSAQGSDDVTDESASLADVRWSSGDEVLKMYII